MPGAGAWARPWAAGRGLGGSGPRRPACSVAGGLCCPEDAGTESSRAVMVLSPQRHCVGSLCGLGTP